MSKSNTTTFVATLFLMVTITLTLVMLPTNNTASALDLNIKFYPEITANPNPIGVGQQIEIVCGFTFATSSATAKGYAGWTITVTRPNNTTFTLGPYNSDATGYFFALLVPDQVGIWKLQAHYPGGVVDFVGAPNSTVPSADTSVFSVTVQSDPISNLPSAPLPTEYWTFPINAENREWYDIAGNWYSMG